MDISANVLAFQTPDVLVGPSEAMAKLWSLVLRVGPYFRTALLVGEPGTGAEAVAQALYRFSPFSSRAFVGMTPREAEIELTESALSKLAEKVLFLPDVERLSPAAQQGLLRLVRLRRPRQVCVIAGATGDLRPLVSAGQFSSELASALGALQLVVPALRERREDIPALVEYLLRVEAKALGVALPVLAAEVVEELMEYEWPGNLEQLQGVLRGMLETPELAVSALMAESGRDVVMSVQPMGLLKLEQVVQEHIRTVLLRCHGNKLKAAEVLGISRSTLYRMLEAPSMAT